MKIYSPASISFKQTASTTCSLISFPSLICLTDSVSYRIAFGLKEWFKKSVKGKMMYQWSGFVKLIAWLFMTKCQEDTVK